MTNTLPKPLPLPTYEQVRECGWKGDVTRYPLTIIGVTRRCEANGVTSSQIKNPAWYYAPNEVVQRALEAGK